MSAVGRLCGSLLSRRNPCFGHGITIWCYPPAQRLRSIVPSQTACYCSNIGKSNTEIKLRLGRGTTTPSGAILPPPEITRISVVSVVTGILTGLIIGATLSKWGANFLEEKELFVPSDDDDDDDDD